MDSRYQKIAQSLLDRAGVTINGPHPWDITIHDDRFYRTALTRGELGIGESYMDGWWDVPRLDEFITRVLAARLDGDVRDARSAVAIRALGRILNYQSRRRAFANGERHYDRGNDLFLAMLDARMNYSCAYWRDASTLDEAQEHKLDLICRKIGLGPGMRVLDIGCGWGGFARFAAERYGASVDGLTVSHEQLELGRRLCEGLPVELRLSDYRDAYGTYDRIVSVGMIEHVGYKNYRKFFEVAHRCLHEEGLFLLHTIGSCVSSTLIDPWADKYIFPNGMIPSVAHLGKGMEGLFVMEDWHNFGADYDRTLMAWYANFVRHWPTLRERYGERFFRMWSYYLQSSAGGFRARRNQLWQIVLSKRGVPGGYLSVR
jgi:cyclopropane-fatty-acyl-phospholipid synthase